MLAPSGVGGSTAAASTRADAGGQAPDGVSGPAEGVFATAARERVPRRFTLAAVGDVLPENPVLLSAERAARPGERYRFQAVFEPVRELISAADLAICHMEIPIGRPGERPGVYGRSPFGGNLLLAPHELAAGLRDTGFDRCSTTSNHANDLGYGGITSTLDALDEVGIGHHGTARTLQEAGVSGVVVNGVAVAHLAYTRFSNTVRPVGWQMAFASSPEQVAGDVLAARAAGAEVVVVSIHIGREREHAPIPADRAFITAMTALAEIDLVVEHGPHVVQPLEVVNGTPVFWSVGNFVSGMARPGDTTYGPASLDGLVASATFTEAGPGRFEAAVTPVLICNEIVARTVHPVTAALADPSTPAWLRAELEACRRRATAIVPDAV